MAIASSYNTYRDGDKPTTCNATTLSGDTQVVAEGTSGFVVAMQAVGGGMKLYNGTTAGAPLIAAMAEGAAMTGVLVFPPDARPRFTNGLFVAEVGTLTAGHVHYWLD